MAAPVFSSQLFPFLTPLGGHSVYPRIAKYGNEQSSMYIYIYMSSLLMPIFSGFPRISHSPHFDFRKVRHQMPFVTPRPVEIWGWPLTTRAWRLRPWSSLARWSSISHWRSWPPAARVSRTTRLGIVTNFGQLKTYACVCTSNYGYFIGKMMVNH